MDVKLSKTAQSYARLFAQGRVDAQALARAVQRGLVTQEEYEHIVATSTNGGAESEVTQ